MPYKELISDYPMKVGEKFREYAIRLTPYLKSYGINSNDTKIISDCLRRSVSNYKPEIKPIAEDFNFLKKKEFKILDPIEDNIEYFKLPYYSKIAFLTDIHLPFYDKRALILAIDYIRKYEPSCIWLNGDILDAYSISRWIKEKNKENLQYEIDCVRSFLATIREIFDVPIYYKIGNHEDRWEHYIYNNAKAFSGIDVLEFSEVFELTKNRIHLIKSKTITQSGKLNILHGHEIYGSGGGVNPSRSLFLKTFKNTIAGHYHRTSTYINKAIDNEIVGCWTVGSLSTQRPMYAPINQYNLGFATIDMNTDGTFAITNKQIIDYKIY